MAIAKFLSEFGSAEQFCFWIGTSQWNSFSGFFILLFLVITG